MSSRRDSRTENEIRRQIHEMNSTQMNCDIETLVGTRLRTSSRVSDEDAQIEQDVEEESSYEYEKRWNDELCDLMDKMQEVLERNEELKKPDFSLAPIWIASCIVAYVYGVTMGLYMCSK